MVNVNKIFPFFVQDTWKQRTRPEQISFFFLVLFAFFASLSIGAAQLSAALAFVFWVVSLPRLGKLAVKVSFTLPALLFILVSLLGVAFSVNSAESLWNARNLLMFLILPTVLYSVKSNEEIEAILYSLLAGVLLTSCYGFYQVISHTGGGTNSLRLTGFLGHYMTSGGVLMLVSLVVFTALIYCSGKNARRGFLLITVVLMIALALTQSRNAYIGLAAGIITALFLWRKSILFLLPFVLSFIVLVSPPIIRDRVFQIFDARDQSIINRVYMAQTGARMIADFPMFGVGLVQVERLYNNYKPEADPGNVPHLHNNFLQVAAERGIIALIFWFWFLFALARDNRRLSNKPRVDKWQEVVARASVACVVALLVAGLFEYNFGDSEVQMIFFLITALALGYYRQQHREDKEC